MRGPCNGDLHFAHRGIASSRRSVSQGAEQKTAREKIKKPRREDIFSRPVFCAAPWLTKRLEEANRGRFQKLFHDRGEITLGIRLAFPATKNNSVEIAYISYKNLRYTFDKFAEEIDGRVLVPSPHVKACDFLGLLEYLLLKPSTTIFPLQGPSNQVDR